ncbi:MAG: hypothetical protein H6Q15_543 [Bacteroidetes bacterium]|nr:hypothetical protein [Bacteroidota bacterium]
MDILLFIILVISGLFVGFINTLSAGGTIISVALYLALGISPISANATNRINVLVQTCSSTLMMKQNGYFDKKRIIKFSIPTIIGSVIGSLIAVKINESVFSYAMGVILLMMIIFLFLKPKSFYFDNLELLSKKTSILHYLAFFGIGLYGGFIQVGTGFFIMMAGTMLIGLDIMKTNALKVAIMGLYTIAALVVFMIDSNTIYWKYALIHSIGTIIGSWFATKFALKKGASFVRWVIIVVIILTAMNLFGLINMKAFFNSII